MTVHVNDDGNCHQGLHVGNSSKNLTVSVAFARCRSSVGLSQRGVAKILGCTDSLVSQWESDESGKSPSLGKLWRLPPEVLESLANQRRAIENDNAPPSIPIHLRAGRIAKESGEAAFSLLCPSMPPSETLRELMEAKEQVERAIRDVETEMARGKFR